MNLGGLKYFILFIGIPSLAYCQEENSWGKTFVFYRDKDYGTLHRGARISLDDIPKLVLGPFSLDSIIVQNDTVNISIGKENFIIPPSTEQRLFFRIFYQPSIIYFFGKFSIVQVEKSFFDAMVKLEGRRKGVKIE